MTTPRKIQAGVGAAIAVAGLLVLGSIRYTRNSYDRAREDPLAASEDLSIGQGFYEMTVPFIKMFGATLVMVGIAVGVAPMRPER